ncbi:unnamed protein product, partial [Darwinula stevensoni]
MNLSGKAVRFWMNQLQIPIEQVFIMVDDLALPFGTLRVRSSGSDAGHNGLKSMQAELGTTAYPRLRFGVGNDFPKGKQVEYVLGRWTSEQETALPLKLEKCTEIIQSFCLAGIQITMNQFNNQNYAAHAAELKNEIPTEPVVFMKPISALLKGNQPLYYPSFTQNLHYEGEIVLRIGKNGKKIQEKFAMTYIDAITLGFDFTARDIQDKLKAKGLPWEIAKGFDGSAAI